MSHRSPIVVLEHPMGTKSTARMKRVSNYEIIQGTGQVVQVAHPSEVDWQPVDAVRLLLKAAAKLDANEAVLLTGGGFLNLTYPCEAPPRHLVLQGDFLRKLQHWTEEQLAENICLIKRERGKHDFIIGVDVFVDGKASGQFALWIGPQGHGLVSKHFARSKSNSRDSAPAEDSYLAGFEAESSVHGQRVIKTRIGKALLLVCHDAQAFNHRNRGSVEKKSKRVTPRKRVIDAFDDLRMTSGLKWALNLVHWVGREENTQTFRRSYDQMRDDFQRILINVVGSFGYESNVGVKSIPDLSKRMTSPEMELPIIVFH